MKVYILGLTYVLINSKLLFCTVKNKYNQESYLINYKKYKLEIQTEWTPPTGCGKIKQYTYIIAERTVSAETILSA
jgi:hypothetical protein